MLGQVNKYSWKDTGSSFGMGDLLAAFLYGQLEQSEKVLAGRGRVDSRYRELLAAEGSRFGFELPVVPSNCTNAYHMFYLLMPDREARDALLDGTKEHGVQTTFHYVPLHSSDAGRRFCDSYTDCPVTDDISGRLIRLPFYAHMTDEEIARAAGVVEENS